MKKVGYDIALERKLSCAYARKEWESIQDEENCRESI